MKKQFNVGHFAPGAIVEVQVSDGPIQQHEVRSVVKNGPDSYVLKTTSPNLYPATGLDCFSVNSDWVTRIVRAGKGKVHFEDADRNKEDLQKMVDEFRRFGMHKPKSQYATMSGETMAIFLIRKHVHPDMIVNVPQLINMLVSQGVMRVVRPGHWVEIYASKKKINKAFKRILNKCLVPKKAAQREHDEMIAESYERDFDSLFDEFDEVPSRDEGSCYDDDEPACGALINEMVASTFANQEPSFEKTEAEVEEEQSPYPANDLDFEDITIASVDGTVDTGFSFRRADGWSFWVDKNPAVVPEVGMTARFYGKGVGHSVRGLFLNGTQIFYRTAEEDKAKMQAELFGASREEWLARWDAGQSCWSISMGGLGPSYEQGIQVCMAEVLRFMISKDYDVEEWSDSDKWKANVEEIETACFANPIIENIGPSGAMWNAAVSLAAHFYRRGPIAIMTDEQVKDRHIQVSKTFP